MRPEPNVPRIVRISSDVSRPRETRERVRGTREHACEIREGATDMHGSPDARAHARPELPSNVREFVRPASRSRRQPARPRGGPPRSGVGAETDTGAGAGPVIDIGAGVLGSRPRVDGTVARAGTVPGPADAARATPAPEGASRPGAHPRAVARVPGPPNASRPGARSRAVARVPGPANASSPGVHPRTGVRRSDPPLRLTRRGKVVLVTVVTMLALGVLWLGTLAAVTASTGPASPAHDGLPYVDVQRGDTLWKIASAVGDGGDPAPMVRQIMNLNGLSGSLIQPGTRLYVPSGMPR